jgi:tetratricopeptide (TPR) repeat protein
MYRETLKLKMEVLGLEHHRTLDTMNNLAEVYKKQGMYVEAVQMHRDTLKLRKEVLGLEHPHTITSRHNLALALQALDEYNEAEQILRQALEGYKKISGDRHPETLLCQTDLQYYLELSRRGGIVEEGIFHHTGGRGRDDSKSHGRALREGGRNPNEQKERTGKKGFTKRVLKRFHS